MDHLVNMRNVVAKAKALSAEHSPDLNKMVCIELDNRTSIYVSKKKYRKYGKKHFIKKYKGAA